MALASSLAQEVFKWSNPALPHGTILQRQSGYNPDLSSCGIDTTCEGACGGGFVPCNASTNLALFCYNPRHGQTCCNNGDGQACDAGYYCARDSSNATWCCGNQYNLAQCASMYHVSLLSTGPPTTSTISSTTSSIPILPQTSSTSSDPTTTTSMPITIPSPSVMPTPSMMGNFNSTFNSTPSAPLFTGQAASYRASLKGIAMFGILVVALLGL